MLTALTLFKRLQTDIKFRRLVGGLAAYIVYDVYSIVTNDRANKKEFHSIEHLKNEGQDLVIFNPTCYWGQYFVNTRLFGIRDFGYLYVTCNIKFYALALACKVVLIANRLACIQYNYFSDVPYVVFVSGTRVKTQDHKKRGYMQWWGVWKVCIVYTSTPLFITT